MIKLIRNIRRSLIVENKTSKYFKYAIGEIVLVVIGILIALQINNWNENQKKLKLRETYVESLIADYTKDVIEIKNRIKVNEESIKRLDSLRLFVHKDGATPDDFRRLFDDYSRGTNGIKIKYSTNTYDVIMNTGNIDLFNKESIEMIMELKKLQDLALEEMRTQRGLYIDMFGAIAPQFPIMSSYDGISPDANKLIWQSVDTSRLPMITDAITGMKHYVMRNFIALNTEILRETELVLAYLNKNYK